MANFVQVNIVAQTQSPTAPSFNVACIAVYHTVWTDLSRSYSSLTAVLADFPTGPVAAFATTFYSQNPNAGTMKVLRLQHAATKTFTLTIASAVDNTNYAVLVNGQLATYNSGAGSTTTTIATGLAAAITALGISGVTAAGAIAVVTITGTSGTYYTVDGSFQATAAVGAYNLLETTVDPSGSTATDLAAIQAADSAWYGFDLANHSSAIIQVAAAWAEANTKVFLTESQDYNMPSALTNDVMTALKASALNRTAVWYHQNCGQFLAAGIMGRFFTFTPGSANYFLKTISGPTVTVLTDSQEGFVTGKNGNVYRTQFGINVIYMGTMASGRFIDTTTGLDWFTYRLQARAYQAMVNAQKIDYTDLGMGVIEGCLRNQLQESITDHFLANDSNLSVTVPSVASQNPTDRTARIVRNIAFTARQAGAAQTVIFQGTLST